MFSLFFPLQMLLKISKRRAVFSRFLMCYALQHDDGRAEICLFGTELDRQAFLL